MRFSAFQPSDTPLYCSVLTRWIEQHDKLINQVNDLAKQKKNVYHVHAGGDLKRGFDHVTQAKILDYCRECRAAGLVVTRRLLVAHWHLLEPTTVDAISEAAAEQRMGQLMKHQNLVKCKNAHCTEEEGNQGGN